MTPIKQKHLKAINKWIVTQSGDEELLNQCTRITIESQIELLDSLLQDTKLTTYVTCSDIANKILELDNELKQLSK